MPAATIRVVDRLRRLELTGARVRPHQLTVGRLVHAHAGILQRADQHAGALVLLALDQHAEQLGGIGAGRRHALRQQPLEQRDRLAPSLRADQRLQ
jgi:hypothetical protein